MRVLDSEKPGAALAVGAPRPVTAFTLMKRSVNGVSVVWLAGVAKDCRRALGRIHMRDAVAHVRARGER